MIINRLLAFTVCVLFCVHATEAEELNAEQRALVSKLSDAISSDEKPYLRQFEKKSLSDFLSSIDNGESWYMEMLLTQIPPALKANLQGTQVMLLELEGCGPFLEPYGLVNDGKIDNSLIDFVRVNLALDKTPLSKLSLNEVSSLRYTEGKSLGIVNQRWLDQTAKKKGTVPYILMETSDGCGAGEVLAKIKSDPPLSDIYIIPDLYFEVCTDMYQDPWDVESCRFWDAAPEQAMVSGVYRFRGVLADGEMKKGKINVSLDGDVYDEQPTVTLR